MDCERYQDRLMELALGARDAVPEAGLHAHLERCESCRAVLEWHQLLAATMDHAIAARVAEEPSPEFLARVRACLAEQPAPARVWLSGWIPATAGALAAVALFAFWLAMRSSGPTPATQTPAANKAEGRVLPGPDRAADSAEPGSSGPPKTVLPVRKPVERLTIREAEVLVPADQRIGVDWICRAMRSDPARTTAVLTGEVQSRAEAQKPVQVSALEIPRLEILPIEKWESSRSPQE